MSLKDSYEFVCCLHLCTCKMYVADRRGGEEAEGKGHVGRTHGVHGTRDAESAGKHLHRGTDRRHPQSQGTCVSLFTINSLKLWRHVCRTMIRHEWQIEVWSVYVNSKRSYRGHKGSVVCLRDRNRLHEILLSVGLSQCEHFCSFLQAINSAIHKAAGIMVLRRSMIWLVLFLKIREGVNGGMASGGRSCQWFFWEWPVTKELVFLWISLLLPDLGTKVKATSILTCCIVSNLCVYTTATKVKEKNRFRSSINEF